MDRYKVGAHLSTPRVGYAHHGIYVGDGSVIHYSGFGSRFASGPVVETTLEDFCQGESIREVKYKRPVYAGDKAVERARSRLGENEYDLQVRNCEHFCVWVLTGISRSSQVNRVENLVDAVVPSFVTIGVKARKHVKQKSTGIDAAKDIGSSVAINAAVDTAISVSLKVIAGPVWIPLKAIFVGAKVVKWLAKSKIDPDDYK